MLFAILIGGAIGFAFGRLPGFVIGAVIAALLVQWAKFKIYQRLRSVQSEFSNSVFAV
ncbi:MAG: co-chaperone DjlA, partial [Halomonadaceae bacterium]